MNAKFLIACLVTTAFVPVASATTGTCLWQSSLDRGACADAGGYAYGDGCGGAQGDTQDGAHVSASGPRASRNVEVAWSCDDWTGSGGNNTTAWSSHDRALRATTWSSRDGAWHETSADWESYDGSDPYGSWHGCGTHVTTSGHGRDLGCPLGAPPAPPTVLP
jgi:hypothetical protein